MYLYRESCRSCWILALQEWYWRILVWRLPVGSTVTLQLQGCGFKHSPWSVHGGCRFSLCCVDLFQVHWIFAAVQRYSDIKMNVSHPWCPQPLCSMLPPKILQKVALGLFNLHLNQEVLQLSHGPISLQSTEDGLKTEVKAGWGVNEI